MVEVGGKPILWHREKNSPHYGLNSFAVCVGYRSDERQIHIMSETGTRSRRVERTPASASWFLCASAYVVVASTTLAAALTLAIGHREKMETGLYLVVFAVLVPAGLVLARG